MKWWHFYFLNILNDVHFTCMGSPCTWTPLPKTHCSVRSWQPWSTTPNSNISTVTRLPINPTCSLSHHTLFKNSGFLNCEVNTCFGVRFLLFFGFCIITFVCWWPDPSLIWILIFPSCFGFACLFQYTFKCICILLQSIFIIIYNYHSLYLCWKSLKSL